jgi:hypothetical protein
MVNSAIGGHTDGMKSSHSGDVPSLRTWDQPRGAPSQPRPEFFYVTNQRSISKHDTVFLKILPPDKISRIVPHASKKVVSPGIPLHHY